MECKKNVFYQAVSLHFLQRSQLRDQQYPLLRGGRDGAIFLDGCWFRMGGSLAGDGDLLTIYRRPGSCESLKVLKPVHLCVLSYKDAFYFTHAPGMARSFGQLVTLAIKSPV